MYSWNPVSSNLFAIFCHRPALPFHIVCQRVDYNRQPHVIQRYHVPSPKNDQYCRHDQAVYSMWMHFVIYCSMKLENSNSHRHAEAEIAAYAHPGYKYPPESYHTLIVPSSSPKCKQSNNLQSFFLEGDLAVNPFTNVNRLEVFRNLSRGEGSQLFSTRELSSCSPSVSSKCALTRKSNTARAPLDALAATQHAYPQPHFSFKDLPILNPDASIRQPLHFDDLFTPYKDKNQSDILHQKDNGEHNMTVRQSSLLAATSHPYFSNKGSTLSAIGLGGNRATHLNCVPLSGVDHLTSFTSAAAMPNPSLLSNLEQTRTVEWEMRKITILNTVNRDHITEEKGTFDMDEEMKRSLYNLIDVEEISLSFSNSCMSPSEDNIELYGCDLAGSSFFFPPEADRTPEVKSPLNFEIPPPTNISNVGSYSPSTVSSILRGSLKNDQSSDFKSRHHQGYGHQEQLLTHLRQCHSQSERKCHTQSECISDRSTSQCQICQYNPKSEYFGSK